ncbi:hypothetical protein ASD77_13805 [Pseudoxanthomonas sp. Root65]|nr:hypothetical protein ASD77_13805 [Pseudoxanthomonas sp. Root65]
MAKKTATRKVAKQTTRKVAAKKTAKTATKKIARKVAKKPAPQRPAKRATTKTTTGTRQAPAAKASAKKVARKRTPKKITPAQALANARSLLEQKLEHDRQPAPWQHLDQETHGATPEAGFASAEAAGKAHELHAAESRMKAIQGSAGTQDRRNQGKRDHRGE